MFFSSGTAQTNGGGSFCMATYSLVSCLVEDNKDQYESIGIKRSQHILSYALPLKPS